jgi:twitching motility protein PilT
MATTLDDILKLATQKGASDVHLKAGIVPVIRKHGQLRSLSSNYPPLTGDDIEAMAYSLMDDKQRQHFETHKDIDLSYGLSGFGRYRINVLKQRGTVRMVIRNIPDKVMNFEELSLPPVIEKIANIERGLVLVTGATGSGKSSTMAAMIDHINRNKSKHILMIEDPTEFLIRDRKSIITQRELGTDTISFAASLRSALRQDPDVILIGEMRDKETIEVALLAAETGHLVLSTLHTIDAQETLNRILSNFEPHQQHQVRLQLASVLRAVVSQRLCQKKDGQGYLPALEVLINNSRIADCIADPQRSNELRTIMEESRTVWDMATFDQSLFEMVNEGQISYEEALKNSTHPENFAIRYSGVSQNDGEAWAVNTAHKARLEEQWHAISVMDVDMPVEHLKLSEKERERRTSKKGSEKGPTTSIFSLKKLQRK